MHCVCDMDVVCLLVVCVCGQSLTVDHAMNCATGGFPTLCHNKLKDFTKFCVKIAHCYGMHVLAFFFGFPSCIQTNCVQVGSLIPIPLFHYEIDTFKKSLAATTASCIISVCEVERNNLLSGRRNWP